MNVGEGGDTLQGRLERLNQCQLDIDEALKTASTCFSELSRDKPPSNKTIDLAAKKFTEKITSVDEELQKQIEYLSQVAVGSSHEGSTYLADRQRHNADHNLQILLDKMKEHQKEFSCDKDIKMET